MVAKVGLEPTVWQIQSLLCYHYTTLQYGGLGWIWTNDTRIFSPLLYRAELLILNPTKELHFVYIPDSHFPR